VKILIVEDEELLLRAVEFKLKKEGYDVHVARNGLEAEQFLQRETAPDVMVTDIMMPHKNGLELTKIATEKGIPVLVLSTQNQEDIVLKAFEMGAEDYMTKPFSPNELMVRIKKITMKKGGS